MKLPSETTFMNSDMTAFLIPVLSVAQSPGIKQVPGIPPVHLTPLNWQLRYHFFFYCQYQILFADLYGFSLVILHFANPSVYSSGWNVIFCHRAAALRRTQSFDMIHQIDRWRFPNFFPGGRDVVSICIMRARKFVASVAGSSGVMEFEANSGTTSRLQASETPDADTISSAS